MSCRTVVRLLLAGAAAVAAGGCWPHTAPPRPHALWVVGADQPAFDPDGPPDYRRAAIERLLTRGLVVEDSTGRIVPAAAERIDVSADSLAYTFHLRQGLRYVDGSECGAEDFRAALLDGLSRADHSTRRWQLAAIRGVAAIRLGRPLPPVSIETLDPRTLRLRLAVPDPRLLAKLAAPGVSDAWRRRGTHSWREAVGLGPLRVMSSDSTRSLTLVHAPTSFPRPELADTLTVRFVPQATRVRQLLRAGRPDLVWPVPPGLGTDPLPMGYRRVAQEARPARWLLLVLRADVPPTSKLETRHALGHGINRTEVLRALGDQAAEPSHWVSAVTAYDFPRLDPQEIELWRERGHLGRSFHVVMAYDAYGPAADVARAMQGEWSTHSIYVELAPLAGAKRRTEFLSGHAHLLLAEVQPLLDDPTALLASLVMPPRGPAVGAVRTGWRTREFDGWILPGLRAASVDVDRIESRLEEERVALPIARLRWAWIERAAGSVAPYHPHFGPECPSPAMPR